MLTHEHQEAQARPVRGVLALALAIAIGPRGGFAAAGRVGGARVGYVGRGAWYRGAGYGYGAAALGGAAAAGAYYGRYGAACGYYPYPPCY